MSQDLVFWCWRGLTLGGLVVIIQTVYIVIIQTVYIVIIQTVYIVIIQTVYMVMLNLTLKLFSIQVKTMKLFN